MSEEQGVFAKAAKLPSLQFALDTLTQRFEVYSKAMGVGVPVSASDGAQQQAFLWNSIIRYVLSQERKEFVALYGELLKWFCEHRNGMLSRKMAFRFIPVTKLGAAERKNLERLLNLLIATADPNTRKLALTQINLKSTLSGFAHDSPLQRRVMAFYGV